MNEVNTILSFEWRILMVYEYFNCSITIRDRGVR